MPHSTTQFSTQVVAVSCSPVASAIATMRTMIPLSTRPELLLRMIHSSWYMAKDTIAMSSRSEIRMVVINGISSWIKLIMVSNNVTPSFLLRLVRPEPV